jgi:hypothetical protein
MDSGALARSGSDQPQNRQPGLKKTLSLRPSQHQMIYMHYGKRKREREREREREHERRESMEEKEQFER